MSTITVTVCGEPKRLPAGTSLRRVLAQFSPYGEEAIICKRNGTAIMSMNIDDSQLLEDGDNLEIYPLIIGG